MRKVLLAAVLTGLVAASQFAGAGTAEARPAVTAAEAGLIQPVQYYRHYNRYERHEYRRWRRHEAFRARHGYGYGYGHGRHYR